MKALTYLVAATTLFAVACGDDAVGLPDAGGTDGGGDAGPTDSGFDDSGSQDAGGRDAGEQDAGGRDGGGPGGSAVQVVLSFDGETIAPGSAHMPAERTSPIVTSTTEIAAFDATVVDDGRDRDAVIADVVAEAADLFAPYALDVTMTPPEGNDYILLVVGGNAISAGAPSGSANLAFSDCDDANGTPAIGLVFSSEDGVFEGLDTADARVSRLATVIAQTAGFTIGLEPVLDCDDVMANRFMCDGPAVGFVDEAVQCGSTEPRDCVCGGTTLNTDAHLRDVVGPAE